MRLIEDIVCRAYFESTTTIGVDLSNPIPEHQCKEAPGVQAEVAFIRGIDTMLSVIPSLFLAVPYGIVADKYGRKIVIFLAAFGIMMSSTFGLFVCKDIQILFS